VIPTIDGQSIERFTQARDHIRSINFETLPFVGFDKFRREQFRYSLEHVDPPAQLYFWEGAGSDSQQLLNAQLSASFGGTVSPTVDGFQMATLLAQATIRNSLKLTASVIGGGVLGIDMAGVSPSWGRAPYLGRSYRIVG
jgi:hypothetical protein